MTVGGGVGGGGRDAEAAAFEEFGEFGGLEIEADAAPALFPPFFFFVMFDADMLGTLLRALVEQQPHLLVLRTTGDGQEKVGGPSPFCSFRNGPRGIFPLTTLALLAEQLTTGRRATLQFQTTQPSLAAASLRAHPQELFKP